MRVMRWVPGRANCLRVSGRRFFLVQPPGGVPALVDVRCPHQGGPLHLGQFDGAERITCPMHRLGTAMKTLTRAGYPVIFWPDQVLALVPQVAGQPWPRPSPR